MEMAPPRPHQSAQSESHGVRARALSASAGPRTTGADNQRIKREMAAALVKELVKGNPFEVAPSLVDRYAEDIVYRMKAQLAMMGLDVEGGGFDDAAMLKEVRADAEAEAKGSILVHAIGEREGIEASEGDVQKRIAELASARGESTKKLRAELEHSGRIAGVKSQIVYEKTVDMLLGQAKIVDEDPDSLIITPEQAGKERLIVTPEEAAAEAAKRRGLCARPGGPCKAAGTRDLLARARARLRLRVRPHPAFLQGSPHRPAILRHGHRSSVGRLVPRAAWRIGESTTSSRRWSSTTPSAVRSRGATSSQRAAEAVRLAEAARGNGLGLQWTSVEAASSRRGQRGEPGGWLLVQLGERLSEGV
jgi:trigger factor